MATYENVAYTDQVKESPLPRAMADLEHQVGAVEKAVSILLDRIGGMMSTNPEPDDAPGLAVARPGSSNLATFLYQTTDQLAQVQGRLNRACSRLET